MADVALRRSFSSAGSRSAGSPGPPTTGAHDRSASRAAPFHPFGGERRAVARYTVRVPVLATVSSTGGLVARSNAARTRTGIVGRPTRGSGHASSLPAGTPGFADLLAPDDDRTDLFGDFGRHRPHPGRERRGRSGRRGSGSEPPLLNSAIRRVASDHRAMPAGLAWVSSTPAPSAGTTSGRAMARVVGDEVADA